MDITAQDSSVTEINYAYDDAYRLTSEGYVLTGNVLSTTSYQYDRAGNRTQMSNSDGITSYIYNKDDELEVVALPNYQVEKYTYDARGNLIQVQLYADGVLDTPIGSPMLAEYDARNLVTRVETPRRLILIKVSSATGCNKLLRSKQAKQYSTNDAEAMLCVIFWHKYTELCPA